MRHAAATLVFTTLCVRAYREQLLSSCIFLASAEGNCSELVVGGAHVHQELDVAFSLCAGSDVEEAVNGFGFALRMYISPDGMFYTHAATLRPGRQVLRVRTNFVLFQWQAPAREVSWNVTYFGTIGLFGRPCGNVETIVWPQNEWHVPRVKVRPNGCFPTPLAKHCCHPLRPQCWGHNHLLAFACCAVPYEPAFASTCLMSNPVFPNKNQDCRGQPLNFFRTFHQGNELKIVVAGRIGTVSDVNASLAAGCLLQSVVYLFHELHHLSNSGEWLTAIPIHRLLGFVRLFQVGSPQILVQHSSIASQTSLHYKACLTPLVLHLCIF